MPQEQKKAEIVGLWTKGYDIIAQNDKYRLVSDPDYRWHIQCVSEGNWYTEASGGLCDESQTREQYLAVVAEHFPEYVEERDEEEEEES